MLLRFPRLRKTHVKGLIICSLLGASSWSERAHAQEVPRYALQVMQEGKRRLYMPMRQEYLTGKPMGFSPLTYPRGEQSEGPISMILVNVSSSADIWTVKVSVVRDVRLYEKRQSPLATYTGRLNDVFKVDEAKSVGIEPFELQIVAVEPEAARVPQIINKTSSIAVMHLSGTIAPEPYSLLMQNQSGKRVIGLEVNAYNGNQRSVLIWRKGLWNGILIEPGSTYELKVKSATGGATTNDKAPSQPDKIEIATVVFLDGSYEGDPLYAALINNEITECDVQVTRALAAIRSAAGQSSDQVIPFLTKASSSLTEKFEVSEINSVRETFQMLNARDWATAQMGAAQGLRIPKAAFQLDVEQFRQTGTNDPARIKAWLAKMSEKYERWLADIHTWSVASR